MDNVYGFNSVLSWLICSSDGFAKSMRLRIVVGLFCAINT